MTTGISADLILFHVFKVCASAFAHSDAILCRKIVAEGSWPSSWKLHWIFPLHKRKSRAEPSNYRGIHLTAQLSKVCERVLAEHLLPFWCATESFGRNQYAYTPKRGYRDALAVLTFSWVWALGSGKRIGVYCSDVAGAFDRVSAERLISKLRSSGVHSNLLGVLSSWLDGRSAQVCVDGAKSTLFILKDQVFQGAVLGPPLWNIFCADAALCTDCLGFTTIVFADDLNCFQVPDATATDACILRGLTIVRNSARLGKRQSGCVRGQ